jgi:hypothetical protein
MGQKDNVVIVSSKVWGQMRWFVFGGGILLGKVSCLFLSWFFCLLSSYQWWWLHGCALSALDTLLASKVSMHAVRRRRGNHLIIRAV